MKFYIPIITLLVISLSASYGQNTNVYPCGTDQYYHKFLNENPLLKAIIEQRLQTDDELMFSIPPTRAVRIIPVVFHIVHQYGTENVSEANINGVIKQLNEDWRMKNTDLATVRSVFQSKEADMQTEFRLARIAPDGKCTNGINRIVSDLTNDATDEVKSLIDWPNTKYLNIWVVKTIDPQGATGTVLGYSYYPWTGAPSIDGVVVMGSEIAYGKRTLTHEIGHWAGLMHTFEGGCNATKDSCSQGDKVCDTPPESTEHFNCDWSQNSCHVDVPDLPDMIENYMCYSYCKIMFTKGQKTRVDYNMSHYRSNIYSTANLQATGIYDTTKYTCVPTADFTSARTFTCVENPVRYTNLSEAGSSPAFRWYFNNGEPMVSFDTSPYVTYFLTGKYKVSLKVITSNGSDSLVKDNYMTVFPSSGQTNTLLQDFENSNVMDSFGDYGPAFNNIMWQRTSNGYHGGHYSLYLNNFSNPDPGQVFYFVLPPVNLKSLQNPHLSFWYSFAKKQSANTDNLRIYISTNCGTTWDILATVNQTALATTTNISGTEFKPDIISLWAKKDYDLSLYKSSGSVFIKFQFNSGGGNDIYFDDINLGTPQVGIPTILNHELLNVYPSPTTGNLFISLHAVLSSPAQLVLTDLLGNRIYSKQINIVEGENQYELNLSLMGIKNGIYSVSIESNENSLHRIISFIK